MPTTGSKRALAPSAPATPPTSPFSAVKRVRLTYTSTNEALVELNAAKEEASLAYISNSGIHPELVETAPKGKGRYKVQWGGKPKSFLMIGTVSAHDVVIKKEADTFVEKLTARDKIDLTFSSADFFDSLFKGSFTRLDSFLRTQPNFKSVARWIPPFDQGSPTTVTIIHPLYKRGDGRTGGAKIGTMVPVPPLKIQAPPIDGSTTGQPIAWDTVEIGSLLCVRFEITVFKAIKGDYAGWNLEALECGLVHRPIGDMEFHSGMESTDYEQVEEEDTSTAMSMW